MKKVVVTGASKGIGKALVKKFYNEGYEVVFCARDKEALQAASDEIKASGGSGKLHFTTCDVAKREELVSFYSFTKEHIGAPDILINNAGIYLPGSIHTEEEGTYEKLVAINLSSAYHLTRLFLADMMPGKKGHIINMCSTASIMPYVNGGSYCITKFALLGMTKVLREELKPHGISVTAVMPGATYTYSWESSGLPEERFMKAEDVAEAIYSAVQLAPSAVVEELLLRPFEGDI